MKELFNQFGWKIFEEKALLPNGKETNAVRVYWYDSVHILAFKTPETILLLREFRPFYQEYIYMLPSGKVDKEVDSIAAAHRELREETGYDAHSLESFGSINLTDSIVITNHLFIAKDLYQSPLLQDDDELIEVLECTIDDAIERVLNSPKVHSPSAVALLKYARQLGQ